jgi:integrase
MSMFFVKSTLQPDEPVFLREKQKYDRRSDGGVGEDPDVDEDRQADIILRLTLTTGMRKCALLALRLDDIDFGALIHHLAWRSRRERQN